MAELCSKQRSLPVVGWDTHSDCHHGGKRLLCPLPGCCKSNSPNLVQLHFAALSQKSIFPRPAPTFLGLTQSSADESKTQLEGTWTHTPLLPHSFLALTKAPINAATLKASALLTVTLCIHPCILACHAGCHGDGPFGGREGLLSVSLLNKTLDEMLFSPR